MSLILLCQFSAQHVSDVNTTIFRSLRLLCVIAWAVLCCNDRGLCVNLFIQWCYNYIMRRVWLRGSVFLQACGVLWLLNIF